MPLPRLQVGAPTDEIIGSVKEAAATIAYGMAKYYTGNNTGDTPGNLPDPHFCESSHNSEHCKTGSY